MAIKAFIQLKTETKQHYTQELLTFLNMGIWEWGLIDPFFGLRLQNFLAIITREIGFCLCGQTGSML